MSDDLEAPMPVYRVPRPRGGLDIGTKRLLVIAGGLGATLLVVLGLSLLGGRHRGVVPVIEADSSPVRVRPEHPGGMSIAGQDDELPTAAGDQAGKLAPAAEAPALQALHAQERADAVRAAAAHPAVPASLPAATPSAAATSGSPAAAAARGVGELALQGAAQGATQGAAAGAAIGAAQAPVQGLATSPPAASVPAPPLAAGPDHRAPAAASRPAAPAQTGGHATEVQLAALVSEDAARAEWARLSRKAPDLLGPHHPEVTRLERDGHVLWRLRTGGFTDVADATIFCEHARSKGLACTIAAF